MYSINSVVVEGTIDGEVKVFAETDGKPTITSASLKFIKQSPKGKDIVSWFAVKAYGKVADILLSFSEGDHVVVYGHLHQERWKKGGYSNSLTVVEPYKILLVNQPYADTMSDNEDANDSTESDEELGF